MRISTAYFAQRGLDSILDQQAKLADIQQQIGSGKRILNPSDDPTGSAQVLRLNQAIALTDQYTRNANNVTNRLSLEESALNSVQNTLLRVRELAVQGANFPLSDGDRLVVAQEVRERLNELLGLANTRDSNQEYLFSGYKVTTKPFSQPTTSTFAYSGDQGQRSLQVFSGRQIADSDSGDEVFVDIKNGNGTFQVNAPGANTGSGIINTGSVFDTTAYVADTYTITFAGAPGSLTYGVTGVASGVVIAAGTAYVDDATIQFNGIQTGISGTPVAGDTFTVSPSSKQDVFSTVQKLITALESPVTTDKTQADFYNLLNQSMSEIDQAFENVTQIRTSIGARLKTVEDQVNVNASFKLELQTTKSSVEDLDITSAIIELQSRLIAMEAAQASYSRIQGLSLFNFI